MNKLTPEQAESLKAHGGECHVVETSDGPCDVYAFASSQKAPAVIFYHDAGGTRTSMFSMARRLADAGYYVLMPNLFHRQGEFAPFDGATVFSDPAETARLMKLMGSITKAGAMKDTAACLGFLELQHKALTETVGCVGYCMGGGLALTAAGTFPEQVSAAASYHGARLANEAPDSPHLLADKIKGEVYVGVAAIDPHFSDAERHLLEETLTKAGVRNQVEVYADVHHGFAVPDMPVFDQAAYERHWETLLALLGRMKRTD